MSSKKIISVFHLFIVLTGLVLTHNLVFADDKSSLEIHNDVIYGGDQEQKQYEHYENKTDLFFEKKEEQNKDLKQKESSYLNELTDKVFQDDWGHKKESSSKDILFQSDYSVPEFILNALEDSSHSWIKIFFGSLFLLGGTLIAFIGWRLGKVFSDFQLKNKE